MSSLLIAHVKGYHAGRPQKRCPDCFPQTEEEESKTNLSDVPALVSCREHSGCATVESLRQIADYCERNGSPHEDVQALRDGAASTDVSARARATALAQNLL